MPDTDLDFEVLRKGRRMDEFDLRADPANVPGLQATLRGWLQGEGWDPKLWPQFSAAVRISGRGKVVQKVRL